MAFLCAQEVEMHIKSNDMPTILRDVVISHQ